MFAVLCVAFDHISCEISTTFSHKTLTIRISLPQICTMPVQWLVVSDVIIIQFIKSFSLITQQQPPHFTGSIQVKQHSPALPIKNWRILLVQFYCPHALAPPRTREKTLQFNSVIYTVSVPLIIQSSISSRQNGVKPPQLQSGCWMALPL